MRYYINVVCILDPSAQDMEHNCIDRNYFILETTLNDIVQLDNSMCYCTSPMMYLLQNGAACIIILTVKDMNPMNSIQRYKSM